jgi:hypothetical protein
MKRVFVPNTGASNARGEGKLEQQNQQPKNRRKNPKKKQMEKTQQSTHTKKKTTPEGNPRQKRNRCAMPGGFGMRRAVQFPWGPVNAPGFR